MSFYMSFYQYHHAERAYARQVVGLTHAGIRIRSQPFIALGKKKLQKYKKLLFHSAT